MCLCSNTHIYATGIKDYCERYGASIKRVITDEHATRKDLGGEALAKLSEHYSKQIPLDKLEEKCQWQAQYYKELLKFKEEIKKKRQFLFSLPIANAICIIFK